MKTKLNKILKMTALTGVLTYSIIYFINIPVSKQYSVYEKAHEHNSTVINNFDLSSKAVVVVSSSAPKAQSNKVMSQNDYSKLFSAGQSEFEYELRHIEAQHKNILSNYRKNGKVPNKVELLEPRLRYLISIYLNADPKLLEVRDLEDLQISSTHMYLLKKFAYSTDFRVLLKRESLNENYLEFENLKSTYN